MPEPQLELSKDIPSTPHTDIRRQPRGSCCLDQATWKAAASLAFPSGRGSMVRETGSVPRRNKGEPASGWLGSSHLIGQVPESTQRTILAQGTTEEVHFLEVRMQSTPGTQKQSDEKQGLNRKVCESSRES